MSEAFGQIELFFAVPEHKTALRGGILGLTARSSRWLPECPAQQTAHANRPTMLYGTAELRGMEAVHPPGPYRQHIDRRLRGQPLQRKECHVLNWRIKQQRNTNVWPVRLQG